VEPIDISEAEGRWSDGWASTHVRFTFTPSAGTTKVRIIAVKSEHTPDVVLEVNAGALTVRRQVVASELFWVDTPIATTDGVCTVTIESSPTFVPKDKGLNDDTRELSYLFRGAEAH
jgi:hypothetical protein